MRNLKQFILILCLIVSVNTFAQDNKKNTKAPEWKVEDVNGKEYSLSDFQGKYVVVDVWATWCGPCRNEIPFYAKIVEKYKDSNVQFISISLDSNKKKWTAFIKNEKVNGSLQLIDSRANNSPAVDAYQINGIPRFLIIDPKGMIVEWQAPRPSTPQMSSLLDKLLKK
jgi:thiol-disulfide isomerase/thioredoxin